MDGKYEYIHQFWLGMVKLTELEDRPDWVDWGIDGLATDHTTVEKPFGEVKDYELWQAEVGDTIVAHTSDDDEGITYEFIVRSAGNQPLCTVRQTNSKGSSEAEVYLKGTGWWGDYRSNPMIRGTEKKISINHGVINTGNYLVVKDPRALAGDIIQMKTPVTKLEIIRKQV